MSSRGWGERLHLDFARALYLHVPFCSRKCAYCDFPSWACRPSDELLGRYRDALVRQVSDLATLGILGGCTTGYVGGGTPTMLGRGLGDLGHAVASTCPVLELTSEANPDSLSDEVIASMAGSGFTRVSVGVQSLDDGELAELGRVHDSTLAADRVRAAVASGLRVSVDLMCAIPRQTDESWGRTISGVLALGAGHVSVYPLAIEEGTAFDVRYRDEETPWNDSGVQAERMLQAQGALEAAGLSRYEVASYALPGQRCAHNQAYWTGEPYLGLGTGASGMLPREGYERLRAACPQLPRVPADVSRVRLTVTSGRRQIADDPSLGSLSFSLELLDECQAAAEDLMLAARLADGIDPALVSHARDAIGRGEVDEALGRCLDLGLLAPTAKGRLAPTPDGWLLGNELYGELWGLARGNIREVDC